MKAFGLENAKKLLKHWPYVYCPTLGNLFTRNANPKVGDIVIFYRGGTFTHTGIVTAVIGDRFYTIEGNTSGASEIVANGGGVCAKSYLNSKLLEQNSVHQITVLLMERQTTQRKIVTQ